MVWTPNPPSWTGGLAAGRSDSVPLVCRESDTPRLQKANARSSLLATGGPSSWVPPRLPCGFWSEGPPPARPAAPAGCHVRPPSSSGPCSLVAVSAGLLTESCPIEGDRAPASPKLPRSPAWPRPMTGQGRGYRRFGLCSGSGAGLWSPYACPWCGQGCSPCKRGSPTPFSLWPCPSAPDPHPGGSRLIREQFPEAVSYQPGHTGCKPGPSFPQVPPQGGESQAPLP